MDYWFIYGYIKLYTHNVNNTDPPSDNKRKVIKINNMYIQTIIYTSHYHLFINNALFYI